LSAKVLCQLNAAGSALSRRDGEYFKRQLDRISIETPEHGKFVNFIIYYPSPDNHSVLHEG
jgi:hypothetical protein